MPISREKQRAPRDLVSKDSPSYKAACWYKGYLRDITRPHGQREIYDSTRNWKANHPHEIGPVVINAHRRLGKSFMADLFGIERAVSAPDQEVRIIAPTDEMCEGIHRKQIEFILRGCPKLLNPKRRAKTWTFKNPIWTKPGQSTLILEGSEYKKGNRQRGLASDLVVLDEFRDMEDPETLIEEVLSYHFIGRKDPLLLIVSTPPATMDHPMVKRFIPEAKACGAYFEIRGDKNKDVTSEDKRMILKVCRDGENGIGWRREFLCELIPDPKGLIVPEFVELEQTGSYDKVVVNTWTKPLHWYPQCAIDTGYDDYNGILFFYYDFMNAVMVILDELWVHRQNTQNLRDMIRNKAEAVFGKVNPKTNPNEVTYYGDLTKQQRADFSQIFQFPIIPVQKTDRDMAINSMRDTVRQQKLRIVGPKCPILIYQLRNGSYAKNLKDFNRSENDDEMGHCDLLAALVYGHRHLNRANPYPYDAGDLRSGKAVFTQDWENPQERFQDIEVEDVFHIGDEDE